MAWVQSVAGSVCAALVLTGLFSVLIPGRSMERTVRMVVGLFFLCSVAFPVAQGDWDEVLAGWDAPQAAEEPSALSGTVEERVLALTEENLEEQAALLLEQNGIEVRQVEAGVHIEEDNSIRINRMRILLAGQSVLRAPAAEELITEQFGFRPEVDWERDG